MSADAPVKLKDFAAWLNEMPPGPSSFITTGVVVTPTTGWTVRLVEAHPQGINPLVKLLELQVTAPTGIVAQHVTDVAVRYEERPTKARYATAEVLYGHMALQLPVRSAT